MIPPKLCKHCKNRLSAMTHYSADVCLDCHRLIKFGGTPTDCCKETVKGVIDLMEDLPYEYWYEQDKIIDKIKEKYLKEI